MASTSPGEHTFDDLLQANRQYAERFSLGGFDGVARAGVAVVTCMDSRIEPLQMLGLRHGDVLFGGVPTIRLVERRPQNCL